MKNRTVRFVLVWALLLAAFFTPHYEVSADVDVEAAVRNAFAATPVMIEIARCESKFRQFSADGSPLYGGWGGGMVGVFQFYESLHQNAALKLGFDLATLEGNIGYAKHLFATSGTAPWNSAKTCWGNAAPTPVVVQPSPTQDLEQLQSQIVTLMEIVEELQKLLDAKKKIVVR